MDTGGMERKRRLVCIRLSEAELLAIRKASTKATGDSRSVSMWIRMLVRKEITRLKKEAA